MNPVQWFVLHLQVRNQQIWGVGGKPVRWVGKASTAALGLVEYPWESSVFSFSLQKWGYLCSEFNRESLLHLASLKSRGDSAMWSIKLFYRKKSPLSLLICLCHLVSVLFQLQRIQYHLLGEEKGSCCDVILAVPLCYHPFLHLAFPLHLCIWGCDVENCFRLMPFPPDKCSYWGVNAVCSSFW